MTEWDKLWKNKPFSIELLICDEKGNSVETDKMKWEKQVKAVGDELQEENKQLRETVGEYTQHNLQLMSDLDDARTRIKVWKHSAEDKERNLEWYKQDREKNIRRIWANTKKLEAIRELFNNPPDGYNELVVSDYDFEKWSEEILVLLGVRKEMQEKDSN